MYVCISITKINAILLYTHGHVPTSVIEICKSQKGPWDCYAAADFFGWEAERVVAVIGGNDVKAIIETLSRAKTHLAIILVQGNGSEENEHWYRRYHNFFQQAANVGLVEFGFNANGSPIAT